MRRRAPDADVTERVNALQGLNIDSLRAAWGQTFGGMPPAVRSGDILRRLLAERLQMEALGGDPELERELARLVRSYRPGLAPKPTPSKLRPGTVLVREWAGETHRVDVTEAGFWWNGAEHRSLSVIARAITGARWNGPRFFGLREPGRPA
jgi:hypothetical protein